MRFDSTHVLLRIRNSSINLKDIKQALSICQKETDRHVSPWGNPSTLFSCVLCLSADSDSVGLAYGLVLCISNKPLRNNNAADLNRNHGVSHKTLERERKRTKTKQ